MNAGWPGDIPAKDRMPKEVWDLHCENLGLRARIAELEAELAKVTEMLQDPVAVRLNILRGGIARPSDLVWLHEENGPVAQIEAARDDALRRLGEMDRLFASSLLIVDHFTGSLWPREVQDAASAMLIDIRAAAALVEREGR